MRALETTKRPKAAFFSYPPLPSARRERKFHEHHILALQSPKTFSMTDQTEQTFLFPCYPNLLDQLIHRRAADA